MAKGMIMPKKKRKTKKGTWGGKRPGAGPKGPEIKNVILHCWVPVPVGKAFRREATKRKLSLTADVTEPVRKGRPDLPW